jgi:hypothetical protein
VDFLRLGAYFVLLWWWLGEERVGNKREVLKSSSPPDYLGQGIVPLRIKNNYCMIDWVVVGGK